MHVLGFKVHIVMYLQFTNPFNCIVACYDGDHLDLNKFLKLSLNLLFF